MMNYYVVEDGPYTTIKSTELDSNGVSIFATFTEAKKTGYRKHDFRKRYV